MNRIRRPILPAIAITLIALALPALPVATLPAAAQIPGPDDFEYGDAPEGQMAYPANGIAGTFPTCLGGPSGYIRHAPNIPGLAANAWFGPNWDLEVDGNGGLCVPPPYEQDECWAPLDNDAGLIIPDSWTIDPSLNVEVPCRSPGPPTSLGTVCGIADWGTDIDIEVHNTLGATAYINVAVDWNQDGRWDGNSACGIETVPEWLIKDLPVPPLYFGTMTGLSAAAFRIGPQAGFVWVRFTITDLPLQAVVGPLWDGSGPFTFDAGETEDYLIRIDPQSDFGDYGDAPEGALAYPPTGYVGQFPTCLYLPSMGHVFHASTGQSFFGPMVDYETDGNAGNCNYPDYDRDECDNDGDSGLITPDGFTIDAAYAEVPCQPGPGLRYLGPSCGGADWGNDLDITVTNTAVTNRYVNVLVDWNQNGLWNGAVTCTNGVTADEHLLVNQVVPAGYTGPLSGLVGGTFSIPASPGYVWTRFTISESPVPYDWDGNGQFHDGETEDYMLAVASVSGTPGDRTRPPAPLSLGPALPNPWSGAVTIHWSVAAEGPVRRAVYDVAGRLVLDRTDTAPAGSHQWTWDGRDDSGRPVPAGLYVLRLSAGGQVRTLKVTRLP